MKPERFTLVFEKAATVNDSVLGKELKQKQKNKFLIFSVFSRQKWCFVNDPYNRTSQLPRWNWTLSGSPKMIRWFGWLWKGDFFKIKSPTDTSIWWLNLYLQQLLVTINANGHLQTSIWRLLVQEQVHTNHAKCFILFPKVFQDLYTENYWNIKICNRIPSG